MNNVGILGFGKYVPDRILTNSDLEKMVETSDEWITTRTGIKERRIASDAQACSDLATEAAKDALKDAGMKAEDIDLIIVATITGDMPFPATACLVQTNIGAVNAAAFDVSAACTGYIYGLVVAEQFIRTGMYRNALVIGAEKLSAITDWQDRNTCVLFGDGAGAAVLGVSDNRRLISSHLSADGKQADLLMVPAGGSRMPATEATVAERLHFLKMKGSEVFKFAVKSMAEAAIRAMEKIDLKEEEITTIIPHQANLRIILSVANRLGVSKDKLYLTVDRYGNMSSASTAVSLTEAARERDKLHAGDVAVLVAFGGGFTSGSVIIKW